MRLLTIQGIKYLFRAQEHLRPDKEGNKGGLYVIYADGNDWQINYIVRKDKNSVYTLFDPSLPIFAIEESELLKFRMIINHKEN